MIGFVVDAMRKIESRATGFPPAASPRPVVAAAHALNLAALGPPDPGGQPDPDPGQGGRAGQDGAARRRESQETRRRGELLF
ncbi:MAG: hypothetical protein ABSB01_25730 [Streptosporangiaceae bacterium]